MQLIIELRNAGSGDNKPLLPEGEVTSLVIGADTVRGYANAEEVVTLHRYNGRWYIAQPDDEDEVRGWEQVEVSL